MLPHVFDQLLAILRVAAVHDADELILRAAVQVADAEGDSVPALVAAFDGKKINLVTPRRYTSSAREITAQPAWTGRAALILIDV